MNRQSMDLKPALPLKKLYWLVLGIGAALPTWAAAPVSPFAERPFSVDGSVARFVNENPPKPNFLFIFDTSNTMGQAMPTGETRLAAAKSSLQSIISRYNNDFNWSMVTVPGVSSIDSAINGGYTTGARISSLLGSINTTNYGTPMTSRYLDAAKIAIDGIEYSCQRSYIVLMSDGETGQNTWQAIRNKLNDYRLRDGRTLSTYFGGLPSNYCASWENGYPWRARHFCGDQTAIQRSNYSFGAANAASIIQNSLRPWPTPVLTQTWSASTYDNVGTASNGYDITSPLNTNDSLRINKDGRFFTKNTGYSVTDNNTYALNYKDGVSYFSHILAVKDAKTQGVDREGRSWNNTLFPKQVIQTYSISFADPSTLSGNAHYFLATSSALSPAGYERDINTTPLSTQVTASEKMGVPGYYNASSQAALTQAFDNIMAEIKKQEPRVNASGQSISTSSPTASMSMQDSPLSNYAAYLTLDSGLWSSRLLFRSLQTGSDEEKVPDYSARTILVNDGNNVVNIDQTNRQLYGLKTDIETTVGLIPWLKRPVNQSDTAIESAVTARLPDPAQRTVASYRVRTDLPGDNARMMADVIGAPILNMLDNGQGQKRYMVTAANDGMLYAFKYTGNTDYPYQLALNYMPAAMQRESTDGSDTIAKALPEIATTGYGSSTAQPHLYLHNGGMEYRTTSATAGAAQQTFLAAALGQGARGAYVVNIAGKDRRNSLVNVGLDADNAAWQTSVPVFETNKSASNKLGYTISTPRIGLVATEWLDVVNNKPDITKGVRNYLFLANGYEAKNTAVPHDGTPTLYIYDILAQEFGSSGFSTVSDSSSGKLIKTIPVSGAYTIANGFDRNYTALSTPTLVDTNADNIFDTAYAGDSGGNIYRFTLKGNTKDWKAVKIYSGETTIGAGGKQVATQPITTAPAVFRKADGTYVVMVGSGSDIFPSDLTNTYQQVMLGIFDDPAASEVPAVRQSQLVKQIFTTATTGANQYDYVSNNAVPDKAKGWVLMLDETSAERIVTSPSVHTHTVFVTTRSYRPRVIKSNTPTVSAPYTCGYVETTETSGAARALQLNVLTGSAPTGESSRIQLLDTGLLNGYYPASLRLDGAASDINLLSPSSTKQPSINVNGQGQSGEDGLIAEAPAIRNSCVATNDYKAVMVDQSGVRTFNIEAPLCNTSVRRISWREIF
ncbi:hypothetical protein PL75_05715 [Neisseria arctica]|uniref:PilY1 beta-propeller domain-containing protein n=1 Tax=Neisseria arctica TaxID=1470200 RepID=A0A0J0YS99_9NEIS|nr:PilC/PilY family type IV pilus protein [Neisseria arctica]KLT72984.1 hypothetical protein PL75_05715 [Neisseria arctica]UOO86485.1 hypothetical protein LVJ86_09840 [Neisseria arctica]